VRPSQMMLIGIVLMILGVFLIVFAELRKAGVRVQVYRQGSSSPPPPVELPQVITKEKETIVKEVVMIPCPYCGGLMPQTALFCPHCGAKRKA